MTDDRTDRTDRKRPSGHRLRVVRPSGEEEVFPLADKPFTMGRSYTNTLVLDDTMASRHHARIERDGDVWIVIDLGSKNGTIVGAETVSRHALRAGDVVQVGDTRLFYEPPPDPPPRPPRPERAPSPVRRAAAEAPPGTPVAAAPVPPGTLRSFAEYLGELPAELAALDEVAAALAELVPCARATLLLVEEGTGHALMQFSYAAQGEDAGPDEPVLQAALTAERPLIFNVPKAGVLGASLGVKRHLLLVPMRADGRKLGLFSLERAPDSDPFVDTELERAAIAGALLNLLLRLVL